MLESHEVAMHGTVNKLLTYFIKKSIKHTNTNKNKTYHVGIYKNSTKGRQTHLKPFIKVIEDARDTNINKKKTEEKNT